MHRNLALLILAVLLNACAVGRTYDYTSPLPKLTVSSEDRIAVGVVDQRPYVVSGHNTPEWVGLQRGGYGIPFGVHTRSGRPLAHDLSDVVARALNARGIEAQPIYLEPNALKNPGVTALSATDAGKLVLVSLTQWKSDNGFSIALSYDMAAEVYDGKGRSLARNRIRGRKKMSGSFFNPTDYAAQRVTEESGKAIERLLNHPKIVEALR